MDMSSRLQVVTAKTAQKIMIYGPPGVGKTSLAAEFPNPVFLQLEEGTPKGLELISFGLIQTYDEFNSAIGFLLSGNHDFRTVVVDSLDKLESLISKRICEKKNWPSLLHPGWGKGTAELRAAFVHPIERLDLLRNRRDMTIICICHSSVEKFDDPLTESYNQYDLNLNEKVRDDVYADFDNVLFLNRDANAKVSEDGRRAMPDSAVNRIIHCELSPAFIAKNRCGMPKKIVYRIGHGYEEISKYLPQNMVVSVDEQDPAQESIENDGTND